MTMIKSLLIPIRLVSEANVCEHWSKKSKRHRLQKSWIKYCLAHVDVPKSKSFMVILTRIAPRKLDCDDNLPMAFKYVKDAIAEYLNPGLAVGRADDAFWIKWKYAQEKGKVREYAIRIEIGEADANHNG